MSQRSAETFWERGFSRDRIFVAHPCFDLAEFPAASFSESGFRILFVGLLEPWKGFHYLIDAYREVQAKDVELHLWGGSGSRGVARYLDESLRLCPGLKIHAAEVRKAGYGAVYGKASVLVLPSVSDGFGYVVAEAMASGLPVIASSACGASDLIEDGVNGFVTPVRDSQAIAEKLDLLIRNPSLMRQLGAAARRTISALSLESFRRSYCTRLQELC
jgi:glycosyltransferase involved in cell wall biosynthesis